MSCIVKIGWHTRVAVAKSMLQLGCDLTVFQMVKHVRTDYVFKNLAAHTGQRYWTVVSGHVFVAFLKIGLIFALLQSFGMVPVSSLHHSCIMHSAFNLFVFPNSMFTPLLLFCFLLFFMKGV